MRNIFFILLIPILLGSCTATKKQTTQPRSQAQILLEQFQNLRLNMPYTEFAKLQKNLSERSDIMTFRVTYEEEKPNKNIRHVIYYFDNQGNLPLYEIIIEYEEDFDLAKFLKTKYGTPNSGKDWIYDSNEGFKIKVWTFDHKLVIAGIIKGTEWNSSE